MKNTTVQHLRPSSLPSNDAIEACLPLVKAVTARIRATRGTVASFEDLYAVGLDGLLDAAERFDPGRGVAFTTFAFYRVRGATLDFLRREAPLRRVPSSRVSGRGVARALTSVQAANDNGRVEDVAPGQAQRFHWSDSVAEIEALPDDEATPADEELDQRERLSRIRTALAALSDGDREIIELHYYEDHTFAQIGEKLGICKPWAFRLHQRAIRRLREAMRVVGEGDVSVAASES